MEDAGEAVPIAELLDERRHLLEVARWMLGSSRVAAEGVIDEAYRRWYGLSDGQRARVKAPRAWLTQVVGGICLARLTRPDGDEDLSRARQDADDREAGVEGEAGAVLLRALESLTPTERAAFVLNDVFGVSPGTVAGVVGQSEPECAELADRARRSLRAQGAHPTSARGHGEIVNAVRQACADGDSGRLTSLLAPDATAIFDGGGKIRALTRPVHGGERVARSLLTLLSRRPRTTLDTHSVNGRTGLVARYDDQVAAVITLDIAGAHVVQVWVVLNPDKLRGWNRPGPRT
ncbi:putative RNA polymerase sigma factor [Streptomyces ambofaciens ATCC 23877]|uniref:Putative RNA polymerase sigma factor n=1 Tax=Streptomyces ambofaciens (strain ATCC 23877 / 3486 / DSM 40053 / JCM 4204 / NBRC 12836 / NRRL B-2516) TaxID=278992 RepID=A3KI82_STRA7|nr:RNA polymerase subunit sigma [Streptomyces ambofaciens]AKZ53531.1 putative RNA polymerase sigma factor [Streptomyces ambofaciens ATCC 23877]CAJ89411.1 putative RNA polymerase sigma factor [Streptomyces ambofaciens ATCC 23877]